MIATILPSDTPLTVEVESKHFSLNVVQLHIELTGIERRAPCR